MQSRSKSSKPETNLSAVRCLTVKGVHNYDTKHLEWGIDFLQRHQGEFPFKDIVTHRYPLDRINAALEMARSGKAIRVAINV